MSNFNIVSEEWDQQLHTTWTYKKQKRLILEILKVCPTSKSFVDLMSKKKLPYKIASKVNLCDPSFNKEQYIEYLKNYIVKYSFIGKFILSSIIGYGLGIATFYGTEKIINNNDAAEYFSNKKSGKNPTSDEMGLLSDKAIDYKNKNPISFKIGRAFPDTIKTLEKYPHISSLSLGSVAKFGTGGLTYKLLDKLDKDRI